MTSAAPPPKPAEARPENPAPAPGPVPAEPAPPGTKPIAKAPEPPPMPPPRPSQELPSILDEDDDLNVPTRTVNVEEMRRVAEEALKRADPAAKTQEKPSSGTTLGDV